ncbi:MULTISPECIES: PilW family protein [unclassified Variovorax]|uniref:PilW family protein n=1 Tax=unclassified Variovorax TaxID=663243 RepID=UPI003F46E800
MPAPHPIRSQHGFSIIELMVGLLVGMLAVLIVVQLLYSTSTQQRLTSTSGDAEINAATATHILTRELSQAGLGISAYTLLGCSLTYTTTSDSKSVTLSSLAPVTINPGTSLVPAGDTSTDTLLVVSGSSASPTEGDALAGTSTATSYTVTTPSSFATGDWVMAASTTRDSTSSCAMTLGKVTAIASYVLTVSSGTAGLAAAEAAVYNLGAAPVIHAYAIRNGNLTVCDYAVYNCGDTSYTTTLNSSVWVPVASHVASLRAQYGRDTSDLSTPKMDGVVDSYDQTTPGSTSDTSGLSSYCGWLRVVGLRLAVVTRSQQYDKDTVTTTAPTWSGSSTNTSTTSTLTTVTPTALAIDLSANSDWKHYRYKTIETTVPLRDIIWNGNQVTYQSGDVAC